MHIKLLRRRGASVSCMELLTSIAVMSSGLLALVIAVLVIAAVFSQSGGSQPLLLDQVLRRQSDALAHRAIASGGHDFVVAVQRCLACTEAAQCRAWLSSGARDGYQQFCPNTGFIERMKR
jgi:ribosomal protein S12 methylthiotransferase accessory factor YcaO